MQANSWIVRRQRDPRQGGTGPGAAPRLRLFCFAYAGGSAHSFADWQSRLDPAIEVCAVQLPGRGARMREPFATSIPALAATVGALVGDAHDLPFALFGHSLGAMLAFEVARHCSAHGLAQPLHLFVSGCAAPQFRQPSSPVHQLPDAQLIDVLRTYNGTPSQVLENDELMALLLPAIRADFKLAHEYRYAPGVPLACPLTVLAGRHDALTFEQVEGWRLESAGPCRIGWFEGDHFFLHGQRTEVLASVNATLLELLGQPQLFRP